MKDATAILLGLILLTSCASMSDTEWLHAATDLQYGDKRVYGAELIALTSRMTLQSKARDPILFSTSIGHYGTITVQGRSYPAVVHMANGDRVMLRTIRTGQWLQYVEER